MGVFIDEIGHIYGKLTVILRTVNNFNGQAQWLCRCECGEEIISTGVGLRHGNITSCGCGRRTDEVGNKYGRLTVVEYAGIKSGKATWLCECECGGQVIARGGHLRRGVIRSCGCLSHLPNGEAAFNRLLCNYQASARKRNIHWALTSEQFEEITKQDCYYCGVGPRRICRGEKSNGHYVYNGIDRLDSAVGYQIDNVVPCCWDCNRMKGEMAYEEFIAAIERIYFKKSNS